MALLALWLQFGIAALLIAGAGYRLCRSADRIAQATGLARGWVGLALLATVTSLPELASGISAVTLAGTPNLAVGNALGACLFNLAFLVVVDVLYRAQPVYRAAGAAHQLSAAFGVVMLGFIALSLLLGQSGSAATPRLLHVGLYSPALLALYLLALRTVYQHERTLGVAAASAEAAAEAIDRAREWRRFAIAAAVVLAVGAWLPFIASDLAGALGWNRSFVGTVFVALVTTLPEMAVTVSALRLRALDLAIGNLLGSNLFNAAIVAVDDLFYVAGPLLRDVAPVHAATAVSAVVMSGLVLIGLVFRPRGRVLRTVGWISIGLIAVYLLNVTAVFVYGG